ncbi:MAG TPA: murein biosynthesis integral membrane protein MurJ [Anaerolineaceae bacterium]|nr:murein biosynthesis integral membrane protein MurJ [Anaerolineaceae bacterium]HUM48748.1 murein biosynthesis integral membrane protein MurJ [Anaerolineaceae bacterium]
MKKFSRLSQVSLLLAVLFTVDKLLGVARQMLISRQFGLSAELDVFNAANNLPDMLFMLISGGALTIAFIPVLTEVLNQDGKKAAWGLFSNVLNLVFLVTAVIAVIFGIFAQPLVSSQLGVAPGFSAEQIQLTVLLLRLNLVATLVFSVSGLVMAGLQANQHFLLPALAPIFYDFGQIFGAIILAPSEPYHLGSLTLPALGLGVEGLVYGVILGALLHLLIQVPGLLKYQFHWQPRLNLKEANTQKVLKLMGPRVLSMLFIQLIFVVQDNIASRLATGSVTALTYGWWIMQVPETLIGTAVATAVLPTLSEFINQGKMDQFKTQIEKAARAMLTLTIPIAIIAAVVILPVVQTLLGFTLSDAMWVAAVTRIFLLGIVGHALVELYVRSFYAMQKPRVPLFGSALTFVVFLGISLLLTPSLQAAGIAAANTLAYSLQAVLLLVLLNRQLTSTQKLSPQLWRSLFAALCGGVAAALVMRYLPGMSGSFIAAILAALFGVVAAGVIVRKDLRNLANL